MTIFYCCHACEQAFTDPVSFSMHLSAIHAVTTSIRDDERPEARTAFEPFGNRPGSSMIDRARNAERVELFEFDPRD